ncbi:MAG: hypothetical protein OSJ45_06830 [Lachnospiraceae bacterium]|nr:hypothetical protein [Lachnospiraceae bacterium]
MVLELLKSNESYSVLPNEKKASNGFLISRDGRNQTIPWSFGDS